MKNLEPRTDFNFNNRWLSEFGAILYSENKKETIKILSESIHKVRDVGDKRYYTGKVLEPRVEPLNIFFKEEIDTDELINWLDTAEPKPFYYDDNTERQLMCILNTDIKLEVAYKPKFRGKLQIEMIAYEPYWTEINPRSLEIENPELGREYRFYYDGTTDGYPTIFLECNGTQENVTLRLSGKEFRIKSFTNNITIQMRNGIITSLNNGIEENKYANYECLNGWHVREMIKFKPLTNNILTVINGDLTKIHLNYNTKWK